MSDDHLFKNKITLWPSISIVIGSVVGSGIFVSASYMAKSLPSAPWFFGIWISAAIITVLGALTQSELAARIPKSGGPYQYLRHAYGDVFGFLYGWSNYTVIGSGAVAAISFVCASYISSVLSVPEILGHLSHWDIPIPVLGSIFPFQNASTKLIALCIIFILTLINVRGIHWSAAFQSVASGAKIFCILLIIFGIFIFAENPWPNSNEASLVFDTNYAFFMALTPALASAFWSYDGWGTISYLSDEVKNPQKNVPLAILIGTAIIVIIYLAINAAFSRVLSFEEMANAPNGLVATQAILQVFGPVGAACVSILIATSTFDCTNATITANARVIFTMAHDRAFLKVAGNIHKKFGTPDAALWLQAFWASVLLISGSFEILISMYVFVNWLTYGLLGFALFKTRWEAKQDKHKEDKVFFKVPGYPWVPAIFIAFAIFYTVFSLYLDCASYWKGEQTFLKSLGGLTLMISGLPLFYYWRYLDRKKLVV